MDFQKAFDKVPHKRLIQKIENYGISGKVLESGADPEKILTFSKLPHPKPHPKTTPKNCNFAMKGR